MKKGKNISKKRIMNAAVKLISDRGVDAVSMREIAIELGVTKPMLYYYFKNKENLIEEIFHEKVRQIGDIAASINENQELEDMLYSVLSNHYKFLAKNPETTKCILKIIDAPKSSPMCKMAMEMRNRNRKKIRALLVKLSEKGKIKKENIEYFIAMTSALISFVILETRMAGKSIPTSLLRKLSLIVAAGIRNFRATALFAALSLSFLSTDWAQPGLESLELTVKEAVELALSNNISVINALENQKIYEQRIKEYWGGVYPAASINASYTRNIEKNSIFFNGSRIEMGLGNAYSASLNIKQVIWSGGKVGAAMKMAELYEKISSENARMTKNTVKRSVKQLYYSVGLFRELSRIQKESLDISRQHLDTIKAQYKQGLQSDLSVMRQEVEVSNNELALIKAENAYQQSLLELKNLLGINPEVKITLPENPDCDGEETYDLDSLYAAALAGRPDFRLAVINRDLAEKQVVLEKAGHWPYLSAFVSKSFSSESDSFLPSAHEQAWSMSAGLMLSLPLFSGMSVVAKVKQAEHSLNIAEQSLQDIKRKIRIDLNRASLDMKESRKRLDSQKTSAATALKALKATELRFKNGLASLLELNDSALILNKAEINYIQARHDLCHNKAQLDWELGD